MEIWADIAGYGGLYQISNQGRVKSLKSNKVKILKLILDKDGYNVISLSSDVKKQFRVHRLVAIAFIPNPENLPQINHVDGDKCNNNVANLQWCDASENMKHAFYTGLNSGKGEKHYRYNSKTFKFFHKQYGKIEATQRDFTKQLGLNNGSISKLITGKVKSVRGWIMVD